MAADQPIYILCGGGSKAPRAAELLDGFDAAREYVILMGEPALPKMQVYL